MKLDPLETFAGCLTPRIQTYEKLLFRLASILLENNLEFSDLWKCILFILILFILATPTTLTNLLRPRLLTYLTLLFLTQLLPNLSLFPILLTLSFDHWNIKRRGVLGVGQVEVQDHLGGAGGGDGWLGSRGVGIFMDWHWYWLTFLAGTAAWYLWYLIKRHLLDIGRDLLYILFFFIFVLYE